MVRRKNEHECAPRGNPCLDQRNARLRSSAVNRFYMIEFMAPWCEWCKALAKDFAAASLIVHAERPDIGVGSVNCDDNRGLCFSIKSLPTLWFWRQVQHH